MPHLFSSLAFLRAPQPHTLRNRLGQWGAVIAVGTLLVLGGAPAQASQTSVKVKAFAHFDQPKYQDGFDHLDYVNPNAPKGGALRQAAIGTFDTLNPFILKGTAASGSGLIYDTLMYQSEDEPFSAYGLVAEYMEVPEDRSWVTFHLNPAARFHDGHPITADDVVWTFNTLMEKGHPFYKSYYGGVDRVEKRDKRAVKFIFKAGRDNRELPLILGQLAILPQHYWHAQAKAGAPFEKTTLTPPLGSGPYQIDTIKPGDRISYSRVKDYWAKDLPIMKGRYNFDRMEFIYFRDSTAALEAFKKGLLDFQHETTAKTWATGYDFPARTQGNVKTEVIRHHLPTGMQGFYMNLRRPIFQDPRVRRAMILAFDFEWSNKALFFGQYKRAYSYFSNSDMAATGIPDAAERDILQPFQKQLPPKLFTTPYPLPKTRGDGDNEDQLWQALELLEAAGWHINNDTLKLENTTTKEPFQFEIMLVNPAFERVVLPYVKKMNDVLGTDITVRMVDSAQYQKRMETFDFDMIVHVVGQSLSPGNEQMDFWHSSRADMAGSRNILGLKNPVVDALVARIIAAKNRQTLTTATKALDRVLLWGDYVVPHWYFQGFRVAYWKHLHHPDITPKYGLGLDTWWYQAQ
jgi:microcin C transport system substrate-binding protein